MKIVSIVMNYIWTQDVDEKAVQIAKRRAALEKVDIKYNMSDDELCRTPRFIVTESQLTDLMLSGQDLKVAEEVSINIGTELREMMDTMKLVAGKLEVMKGGGDQYNGKCEVHMPGNALMTYNVTMLLEDSCTDALQREMDNGWRIIAACPQPDARRPDYILGRYDPNHEARTSAYRPSRY